MEKWLNQHSPSNVEYSVRDFISATYIAKQVLNECDNKSNAKTSGNTKQS